MERGIERCIKRVIERGIERGIKRVIERGIERGIKRVIERGIERGIDVLKFGEKNRDLKMVGGEKTRVFPPPP